MITWLLEPLSHDFMVRALLVSALVGGVCGLLSCYMTLKGWALMGDAVSHAVLPGVVLAYACLLYTSPSPRDYAASRMPSSA